MAFEENAEELAQNVASLGFDLKKLIKQKKLIIDYVRAERIEIEETGEYDLEGLFIRMGHAIDTIGARRVVLDTIEVLFAALPNHAILRAELQRLFRWLKDRGVSAVIGAVVSNDDPTANLRLRKVWLSHRDLVQLVEKSLNSNITFGIYYGVSNNKGVFWDITNARAELGYEPQDAASTR